MARTKARIVPRSTSETSQRTSQKSESLRRADYSTWLTKAAAAAAIGCGTKTIELLSQRGLLEQARYRRPTGGPALAVYNPLDVAKEARERNPRGRPFVMPAEPQAGTALALPGPLEDPLVGTLVHNLVAAFRQAQQPPAYEPDFITVDEAAAKTGLTAYRIRTALADKSLPGIKGGRAGWRIHREVLRDWSRLLGRAGETA